MAKAAWDLQLPDITGAPDMSNGLLASIAPQAQAGSDPLEFLRDPNFKKRLESEVKQVAKNPNAADASKMPPLNSVKKFVGMSNEAAFDDMFKQNNDRRLEGVDGLKEKLAAAIAQDPSALQKMDLSSAMSYADSMNGARTAQSYKAPTAVKDREAKITGLQKEVSTGENAVADDQLGYLRLKAQEEMYKNQADKAARSASGASDNEESKLRREYLANPAIKGFNEIDSSYQAIESNAANTGPAQQALVYQFSKLLDPGSVVRETEYAMSAANAGKINELYMLASKWKTGDGLSADQIVKMKDVARNIMKSYRAKMEPVRAPYRELALRKGFNPANVVIDTYGPLKDDPPALPPGTIKGGYSFNGGDPADKNNWKLVK